MSLAVVADFLAREIGLEPEVLGERNLAAAVATRAAALGLANDDDYFARLAQTPGERAALIEEVVVAETWFFREPAAFEALAVFARERAQRAPTTPLRVLCVPCATGEEPASIAMTLLDAGLTPEEFVVDARDVSAQNVARAEQGFFGRRATRERAVPERYVIAHASGPLELHPRVRAAVRYSVDNAVAPGFLADASPFDAIFCRNLLIYLTRPARERCLAALAGALAPGGLLFTGHAEAINVLDARWVAAGPPGAFVYRRVARAPAVTAPAPPPSSAPRVASPAPAPPPAPVRAPRPLPVVRDEITPADDHPQGLDPGVPDDAVAANRLALATDLADRGQVGAALAVCDESLRAGADGAALRHLIGVLHLARGDADAAERALVAATLLEPAHVPSLLQLSALFRRRGNAARAAGYRRRALDAQRSGA